MSQNDFSLVCLLNFDCKLSFLFTVDFMCFPVFKLLMNVGSNVKKNLNFNSSNKNTFFNI